MERIDRFMQDYCYNLVSRVVVYAEVEIFIACLALWAKSLLTGLSIPLIMQFVLSLLASLLVVAGLWLYSRISSWLACSFAFGGLLCHVVSLTLTPDKLSLSVFTFLSGLAVLGFIFMRLFPGANGETSPFDAIAILTSDAFLKASDKLHVFGVLTMICIVVLNVSLMLPVTPFRQSIFVTFMTGAIVNFLIMGIHLAQERIALHR